MYEITLPHMIAVFTQTFIMFPPFRIRVHGRRHNLHNEVFSCLNSKEFHFIYIRLISLYNKKMVSGIQIRQK